MDKLVSEYLDRILSYDNPTVMLQGEFVFTFRLVTLLKKAGIKVLAGISDRKSFESVDENGKAIKKSEFVFEGFREY